MQYYTASVFLGEPSEFGLRRCAVELQTFGSPLSAFTFYIDGKQHITKVVNSGAATILQIETAREFLRAALASEHLAALPRQPFSKRMRLRRVPSDHDFRVSRLKKQNRSPRAA